MIIKVASNTNKNFLYLNDLELLKLIKSCINDFWMNNLSIDMSYFIIGLLIYHKRR